MHIKTRYKIIITWEDAQGIFIDTEFSINADSKDEAVTMAKEQLGVKEIHHVQVTLIPLANIPTLDELLHR